MASTVRTTAAIPGATSAWPTTRHISGLAIHPHDPDTAYVAALGHAWGTNPERGIYRTTDGGVSWDLVLHKSERAGAAALSLDPTNPRILYAALWQGQRYPHAADQRRRRLRHLAQHRRWRLRGPT